MLIAMSVYQKQENAVAQLPKSTIRLLASSQVITSVSSVVKELMENALDAGAASIDIRLEKHGLEKIEVKDGGCGIQEADCTCMALPHYTSKFKSFSDLDQLVSYGFRGEALHSVCSVAAVSITTKTSDDTTARRYRLDKCGQAVDFEAVHGLKGTTVTVTDLFKNLPVRRQVMSCTKRMNEELKKVENVVKSLSVINPGVRVSLAHNKCLIWQKTAVKDLRLSVMQVFSYNLSKYLHHIVHHNNKVELEMLVPKHDCDIKYLCSGTGTEAYHLFVSKRPVKDKDVEKVLSEVLSRSFGNDLPPNKSVLCIVAITLPPDRLDINLEPNKTKVFIKDKEEILSCITDQLDSYYSQAVSVSKAENVDVDEPKPKKIRMEVPRENGVLKKSTLVNSTSEISDNIPVMNKENCDTSEQINIIPLKTNIKQQTNIQGSSVPVENINIGNDLLLMNTNLEEGNGIELNGSQESENNRLIEVSPSLHNESTSSFFEKTSSPHSVSLYNDLNPLENHVPEPNNSNTSLALENNGLSNKTVVASIFSPQKVVVPVIEPLEEQNGEHDVSAEIFTRELIKGILDEEKQSVQQLQMMNGEQHNALDNPSLSQWSRGGLISTSGNKIMGSCVLKQISNGVLEENQPEKSLIAFTDSHKESTETSNPTSKTAQENDEITHQKLITPKTELIPFENDFKSPVSNDSDAGTIERQTSEELANNSFSDDNKSVVFERSVSSQMGNKQMSGFTAFARQMRSEILKESPGMSFTAVAGILASKWRSLQEQEKERYNSIASSNKKKKKLKTVERDVKKENLKSSSCDSPSIERNFIFSDISMESLSRASLDVPVENSYSSVVGRIEFSDIWICTRISQQNTAEIGVINSQLLDEAYRFKQNMTQMEIPLKPLGRNIAISPRFLTEKLWDVLLSLESVADTSGEGILITDRRIVMNGFRIRISSSEEKNVCAHLTELSIHVIDLYGVDDIQMTLELIEKQGVDHCTVEQSRCPNVIKYIRSETSRQCSQMMNHDKLNDTRELEDRLRMLENDKSTCWESFYKALHVLQ
ncbi:hypothetical protein LSTR_LSTR012853 [Laodelphax striatellus]|uniref:HMG box domain-containing protein n=1 Tax=Laodelphax striatellus TaxID=195883 RepID=A0A482XPL3_LAOST|nr:hypothetical protein LSTR_LSTR012853 [Laodelphax striatellus]